MRKIKNSKGITLIALIITIIVLLILAVVAISEVQGDGIIAHAKNARDDYQTAQETENTTLADYMTKLNEAQGEGGTEVNSKTEEKVEEETPEDSKTEEKVEEETPEVRVKLSTITGTVTSNTLAEDDYGNKITIPNGFKIASDSGKNVTQGIVIEDVNNGNMGSQFVWVPCGTIYTSGNKTSSKIINLGRYINFTEPTNGYVEGTDYVTSNISIKINSSYSISCIEATKNEITNNTHAIDIEAFKTSVANNGGYYIGRYEAGDSSATSARSSETEGTLVCKANQEVYNYITQPNAAIKCRNMYTSSNFTSDLVNSYAWDTAIIFIQTFSGSTDYSTNSRLVKSSQGTTLDGTGGTLYCNISNIATHAQEFTTESTTTNMEAVCRGGSAPNVSSRMYHTCICQSPDGIEASASRSFRPIIYL